MSLRGKNRAVFSYNNKDRSGAYFQYKDFEKTDSYHSSFINARFQGTSLRAAKFKYCDFSGCVFEKTDFIGTNLRGSKFEGANFVECVFISVVFDRADFKNATFKNCYILGNVKQAMNFPKNCEGIVVVDSFPPQDSVSKELMDVIEELRHCDAIRRSRILHGRNGRVNTFTIMILKNDYSEEQLIHYLPILPELITTEIHTLSHVKTLLNKASVMHKI